MLDELIFKIKSISWQNVAPHNLIALIRPGIKITTSALNNEKLPFAISKFGGCPEFPLHFEWPQKNGIPLAFVAQINLEQAKTFDKENLLPPKGMLYFFYLIDEASEYYPTSSLEYSVVYYDGSLLELNSRPYPENIEELAQIEECEMNFMLIYTMPTSPYNSDKILELNPSSDDITNLNLISDFLYQKKSLSEEGHQLLGEAESIQSDVRYEWALQYLGINHEIDEVEQSKISKFEDEFTLLFQIDPTDKNSNLTNLSGEALIYYGIRTEDLKKRNFNNIFLTCQAT